MFLSFLPIRDPHSFPSGGIWGSVKKPQHSHPSPCSREPTPYYPSQNRNMASQAALGGNMTPGSSRSCGPKTPWEGPRDLALYCVAWTRPGHCIDGSKPTARSENEAPTKFPQKLFKDTCCVAYGEDPRTEGLPGNPQEHLRSTVFRRRFPYFSSKGM